MDLTFSVNETWTQHGPFNNIYTFKNNKKSNTGKNCKHQSCIKMELLKNIFNEIHASIEIFRVMIGFLLFREILHEGYARQVKDDIERWSCCRP